MKRIFAVLLSVCLLLSAIPTVSAAEEDPVLQTVALYNFDDGSTQGVYGMGSCSAAASKAQAHSAPYSLCISNRTEAWNAGQFDMSGQLKEGNTYRFSAYVYHESAAEASFQFTLKVSDDNETGYQAVASATVPAGEWNLLVGEYTVNGAESMMMPYVELTTSLDSYYIDDIRVDLIDGEVIPTQIQEDIISLKDAFENVSIGATIGGSVMSDPSGDQLKLLTKHFDSFAIENQLKAQFVLDFETSVSDLATYNEAPALDFSAAKPYLDLAQEKGLKVNAQTLVWHSMTPEWFFHEDYDVNKPFASRELMLTRLENYIEGVLTWCEENYPGLIAYWIVVNEAIGDSNNEIRKDALWYETIGEDYVAKAFEFANKYKPENCDFLYNDYNMEGYTERTQFMLDYLNSYNIIENGWIDAFGFQAHIQMGWPGTGSMKDSMRLVDAAGLKVYVTELDIKFGQSDINNYEAEYFAYRAQKDRYVEIFSALMELIDEGVTIPDITLWGLTDAYTWLTSMYGEAQYPMLFDKYNQAKLAYYGLLEVAGLAEPLENLALNCDAYASGIQADNHAANYAFDGDIDTRWSSQTGDKIGDYWVYVDLGEAKTFNLVKIKWEDCFGKKFYLQYANENPESEDSWTNFTGKLIGEHTEQSIFTDEYITARYVRMFAIEKSNDHWGCSIWEMGIYFDSTVPENPYNKDPNASENYALEKTVTASSVDGNHTADLAVDGDKKTRWNSDYSDPQSITVDLGEELLINRVILRWEAAYGKDYTIEVSNDNEIWTTVYSTSNGTGGIETIDFDDITARYVKMNGTARGTNWAYSLYEFEVYYVTRPVPGISPEDFGITLEGSYAYGIPCEKTAEDYEGLEFDVSNIVTGTILTFDGVEYAVIIKGDVTGDGKINSTDFMQIRKNFLGTYEMTELQLLAADVTGDGKINSTDFMQVRKHFLGTFELYA